MKGGVCEVEAYSCMYGFGGEVEKMNWTRDKKAWRGEAAKLRHTLACKVWGGGLEHDLDSNTRSRAEGGL